MAYGVKYKINVPDVTESRMGRVDILEDGYVGSATWLTGTASPCKINSPTGDDLMNLITGRQAVISFQVRSTAEISTYDEFLNDPYQKKKVKFYPDGTNIEFVGWLQPANASRKMEPYPVYTLSATDGIANLKNVDYLNSGVEYSDVTDGLTIIKRCIALTGIDDLNITTQINTYETSLMTSSQNPLKQVKEDNRRFYSLESGEYKPWKAYDVLKYILVHYNCRFYQDKGYWNIANDQEPNSYRVIYNYSNLSVNTARAAYSRILDVSSKTTYPEKSFTELTKIQPIKKLRLTFKNKNLGDNEFSNGDMSAVTAGVPDGWTNHGFETFDDDGGSGYLRTAQTDANNNYFDNTTAINIASFQPEDYIKVKIRVKLVSVTLAGGNPYYPAITINVEDPYGTVTEIRSYVQSLAGNWITLEANYPISYIGNHKVRFGIQTPGAGSISAATYDWDDAEAAQAGKSNTTFDSVYIFENSNNAYREEEMDIVFGDSTQTSDIGALKVGSTLTSSWSRYSKVESKSIQELVGRQVVNNYQTLKEKRVITIKDDNNNIGIGTVLQIGSKYYTFHGNYERDYRLNWVKGEIHELLTSDATVTVTIQPLTSADGQTNESTSQVQTQLSYWLPTADGIYTSQNVAVGMAPTGAYQLEIANDAYIGGDLTVVGTLSTGTFSPSSIVLANGTKTATLAVDSSGNLTISLNTSNTSVTSTGDFVAYASASPPDAGWWDGLASHVDGTTIGYSGGVLVALGGGGGGLWTQVSSDIYYTTGKVAIGTTTFSEKLTVAGNIRLTSNGQIGVSTGFLLAYTEDSGIYLRSSRTSGSGKIYLNDDNANDVSISAGGGNVGVGTTSPGGKFDAYGGRIKLGYTSSGDILDATSSSAVYLKSSSYLYFQVPSGSTIAYFQPTSFTIGVNQYLSGANLYMDNAKTMSAKNTSGTYETFFWPRWSDNAMYMNYGSGGYYLRDNSSNNVIHITSGNVIEIPQDVAYAINFTATTSGSGYYKGIGFNSRVAVSAINSDAWLYLNAYSQFTNGVYTPGKIRADGGLVVTGGNHGWYNRSGGLYSDVRLLSIGGSSNSTYDSFAFGTTSTNLMWHRTSDFGGFYNETNGWMAIFTSGGSVDLRYANSTKLVTTSTGISVTGAMYASGEVTAYSDKRIKSSIRPYDRGLEKVLKMNPVYFHHDLLNYDSLGLIAQEMEEIEPLLIGRDGEYLSLNYQKVVVPLISAIQEQQKEIETLKNKLSWQK